MKFKNLKIGAQLKLGTGAMLLLVIILSFEAYRQTNKIQRQTENLYNHPLKADMQLAC